LTPRFAAEFGSARLGRGKGNLCAARYHPCLELGDGGHLLQHETARWPFDLREVGKAHVNASL
jgi:hypothetical protein